MALFAEGKLFREAGTGTGGGDKHNKGYFVDESALTTAYPTAEAGDYAIVESTDTVWVWDSDNNQWVDSDQKGQVTSVNGQTGAVVLTIPDAVQYSTMPTASADNLGKIVQFTGTTDANYTNGYFYQCVSDGDPDTPTYSWTRVDVQPSGGQVIQYTEMPLADSSMSQSIIQYVGYLNPFYVRGYFYFPTGSIRQSDSIVGVAESDTISRVDVDIVDFKNYVNPPSDRETIVGFICTDSEDPEVWEDASSGGEVSLSDYGIVYSGTVSDYDMIYVKYTPAGGGTWTQTDVQPAGATYTAGNGISIDANNEISVADPVLVNKATGTFAQTSVAIGATTGGSGARTNSVQIGYNSYDSSSSSTNVVCIGADTRSSSYYGIAIGSGARVGSNAAHATQIGSTGSATTNSDANTFKVGNENGNFEIMSADGTIPEARLADTTNAQQGDVLTLDSTGNAVWQAGGGGASYTAGTGIDITNDVISVADPVLVNKFDVTTTASLGILANSGGVQDTVVGVGSKGGYRENTIVGHEASAAGTLPLSNVAVGKSAVVYGEYNVAIGSNSAALQGSSYSTAIGRAAKIGQNTTNAIQLGAGQTNSDSNTFKVANANGNFELMNANGNLPADRLASTTGLADGNYRLRLVMASGVPTLSWVAE